MSLLRRWRGEEKTEPLIVLLLVLAAVLVPSRSDAKRVLGRTEKRVTEDLDLQRSSHLFHAVTLPSPLPLLHHLCDGSLVGR